MMASPSHHQTVNSSTGFSDVSSDIFYGFTNEEICYVSSDVWEIQPRHNSCTIRIHQDGIFDSLELEVNESFGPAQNMANNGNIYRGQLPTSTGSTAPVTITFYRSTMLVRVQGSGYAMWINKVLPNLADKVTGKQHSPAKKSQSNLDFSTCPSTPIIHNSTPYHRLRTTNSTSESDHCSLHRELLQSVLNATEVKASMEKENSMLRDRVSELSDANAKLHNLLTEKQVQIEMMMTRITDVELLEFESSCNLKLLEATEAKFAAERQQLLLQIQDLTCKSTQDSEICSPSPDSDPPVPSYSDVVRWSTVQSGGRHKLTPSSPVATSQQRTSTTRSAPKAQAQGSPVPSIPLANRFSMLSEQAPDTDTNSQHDDDAPPSNFQQTSQAPRSPRTRHSHQKPSYNPPASTSNRFEGLKDQLNESTEENKPPKRPPHPHPHQATGSGRKPRKHEHTKQKRPHIHLFGDSISKRIGWRETV